MSDPTHPLFDLLPAIHRIRDEAEGDPLRTLLDLVGEEVAVLEESLEQFYDDQFIETCAEWVVPYLGDLIGYRSLHHSVPGLRSPRAEVADTIAFRRRKGTVPMLEQLALAVTGWPCKVVEFFELLQTTQFMNHPRLHNALTPDLRAGRALADLGGGFDRQAHSVDTRSIRRGEGRHNIPNLGFFLWRIESRSLGGSPAVAVDAQRFRFHPLGVDSPLHRRVEPRPATQSRAGRSQIPAAIARREAWESPADFYGPEASFSIDGVPPEAIRICHLGDSAAGWAHTPPPAGTVAIDPELGRIAFAEAPVDTPLVSFHYGQALGIGGGEYERGRSIGVSDDAPQDVAMPDDLQAALDARVAGVPLQVNDSGRYTGPLNLALAAGERCEVRVDNGRRPTIDLAGEWTVSGAGEEAELVLNGLLIAGGPLRVGGGLRRLRLVHCTLVPGRSLDPAGEPLSPGEPSLIVEGAGTSVELDRCIVGGIRLHELSRLSAVDCVIDANGPTEVALAGPGVPPAGSPPPAAGTLRLEECTVVGKLHAVRAELVSNCLLFAALAGGDDWPAAVMFERKQTGCVRFSWVPEGARTPRRFRCQPDLEIGRRIDAAARRAEALGTTLTEGEKAAIRSRVRGWLRPSFTSLRSVDPGYAQLRQRSPCAIRSGADDESAMGATHDLHEPQRFTNLRIRLEEYLRFGLSAGVFPVT